MIPRPWLLSVTVWFVAVGACTKQRDPSIARLEQVVATVERSVAEDAPWQPAAVGNTFVLGSAVRTGPASRARLLVGKSTLNVDPESIVRFTRNPGHQAKPEMLIETGSVELESGDESVDIGQATLEPNTRARLTRGPNGLTIAVTLGRALLEGEQLTILAAGQTTTVAKPGAAQPVPADARPGPERPTGPIQLKVTGKPARRGSEALAVGEHAGNPGDAIDAPAGSTIEVIRGTSRAVVTGPARLEIGDGDHLIALKAGGVALHAETTETIASVPGGSIHARAGGTEAQARIKGPATEIVVQRGETAIQTADGEQLLTAGESANLATTGALELTARVPQRAMVSINAGESPVLHDPHAPTAVRVKFGPECAAGGTVEVAKDRSFKRVVARSGGRGGGANVLLAPGAYSYRVLCGPAPSGQGTIRIAKDSGRAPLPKAAARTLVEADGREYTILYQNLLPELTLAWRNAPKRSSYTFVIKPRSGAERRWPSPTPQVTLRPGELAEGHYAMWVEGASGGRSDQARIVIEFDNAAAFASIESVESKGGKVLVKGTVIEGSTVSAGGSSIELDRHRRFTAELAPQDGEDGVSVRIAHPKAGVHYYVMTVAPT